MHTHSLKRSRHSVAIEAQPNARSSCPTGDYQCLPPVARPISSRLLNPSRTRTVYTACTLEFDPEWTWNVRQITYYTIIIEIYVYYRVVRKRWPLLTNTYNRPNKLLFVIDKIVFRVYAGFSSTKSRERF